MTMVNHKPRAPERRRLTSDQRTTLLQLEELLHTPGALSDGARWCAVRQELIRKAVTLIRELRKVDDDAGES
jgi:hypothetical protein